MRTFGERPGATLEIDVLADVVPRLQDAEPRSSTVFRTRILPPFRIREGRPLRARLFRARYRRKPWRYGAMTVSGFTMRRAERQLDQTLESQIQRSRSQDRNRRRRSWFKRCSRRS